MAVRKTRMGGLVCRIASQLKEGEVPKGAVVLCHGYGATGRDLIPIGELLLQRYRWMSAGLEFVFPEAPLSPPEFAGYEGRAWWPLSIANLISSVAAGRFEEISRMEPPELSSSRDMLMKLIEEYSRERGVPVGQIVVGGFSQGAMLSVETVLNMPEGPAGLVIWSGTLIHEESWRNRARQRAGLPVYQSHGMFDELLPLQMAHWLRDLLIEGGLKVQYETFSGGHEIPPGVLESTVEYLEGVFAGIRE